jgi:hypothetical protein
MDDELLDQRFELIDDRFEHHDKRLDALEQVREDRADARESRHARAMNWTMVGLFVAEVVIGILQLAWIAHHA